MNIYSRLLVIGLIGGLVGLSATASAAESANYRGAGSEYKYALVTQVTPVYSEFQRREPRNRCWDEQVAYQQPKSPVGAIIGGLIGAAVGNKVGRGNHRHHNRRHSRAHRGYRRHHSNRGVATVAGAAIGAVIGNEINRSNSAVQYTTQQRCALVDEVVTERELLGYDVSYRYKNREYLTRTDHHPGDRIRVRIDVTPDL